jgi:hypothetical protein
MAEPSCWCFRTKMNGRAFAFVCVRPNSMTNFEIPFNKRGACLNTQEETTCFRYQNINRRSIIEATKRYTCSCIALPAIVLHIFMISNKESVLKEGKGKEKDFQWRNSFRRWRLCRQTTQSKCGKLRVVSFYFFVMEFELDIEALWLQTRRFVGVERLLWGIFLIGKRVSCFIYGCEDCDMKSA